MTKLDLLFKSKQKNILSIYFTAGFPRAKDFRAIIETLEKEGVDIIEIGIPFSDPVADGETIQKSNQIALKHGISLTTIFEELKNVKTNIPIVLMGYFNPIHKFGVQKFCEMCRKTNIAGAIIPDLPIDVYNSEYSGFFFDNNVHFIPLVSPQTMPERLKKISSIAKSFIYAVSQNSITGKHLDLNITESNLLNIKAQIKNPLLAGFGIHNKDTFQKACKFGNGAIIGSAFINQLENSKDIKLDIRNFIQQFR